MRRYNQEAPDRDFALVAKRALTYLKYIVYPRAELPAVVAGIRVGLADAHWHARASEARARAHTTPHIASKHTHTQQGHAMARLCGTCTSFRSPMLMYSWYHFSSNPSSVFSEAGITQTKQPWLGRCETA